MIRTADVERLLADLKTDVDRLIAGWPRDDRAAGRDGATTYPTLAATFAALDDYRGLGYPSGGSSGTRGGDATPLPERLAIAGARDDHAAAALAMAVALRMAAELVHDLVVGVAKHAPLSVEQCRPRATATCLDCNRTIADTAIDPVKAGRCTSSKDEPAVGCYGKWERLRKAAQRGRTLAEDCEGVPGDEDPACATCPTEPASLPAVVASSAVEASST